MEENTKAYENEEESSDLSCNVYIADNHVENEAMSDFSFINDKSHSVQKDIDQILMKNENHADVELTNGVSNLQIDEIPDTLNSTIISQKMTEPEKRKLCWMTEEKSSLSDNLLCKCEQGIDELCLTCFLPLKNNGSVNSPLDGNELKQNICHCNFNDNLTICENCFLLCENVTLGCKRKSDEGCFGLHMQMTESEELLEESTKWLSTSPCSIKKPKMPLNCTEDLLQPVLTDEINLLEDDELTYELELEESPNDIDLDNSSILLHKQSNDNSEINTCPFDILPAELKLKIFSYFSQRQLCRYIAPVCSLWFRLAKDISFWQHLDTTNEYADVATNLIVRVIISWCGNITNLELNKRDTILKAEFREIFQNCPNIQYLSLAFCSQIDNDILNLIGNYCKCLKGINLEGCPNVTDESFFNFIELPLCRINVSHCNMLSDDGGIFLVRNFKNLVEVNFDGIQWMSEDFVRLLVEIHHKTLEGVYMDGENLGDDAVRNLSRCKQLKALSFSFCTLMTHQSVDWIGGCDKIEHLRLRKGSNFTNSSLLSYLKNMSVHQGLRFSHLNLAECTELSDKCLFYLSEKCPNLTILDLSWCWEVSDDGLAHIIDNCQKLKELHLKGLHEVYGTPFFHLPQSVPDLVFLDLSQCNKVQDELIKYVVDKMTELIVHNYYGEMVINARRHDVSKYLDNVPC